MNRINQLTTCIDDRYIMQPTQDMNCKKSVIYCEDNTMHTADMSLTPHPKRRREYALSAYI
ncbi:hypothetical protein GCM10007086_30640 [Photobacterium aphoticum]|nr:hypothetical protein GCM10007086_30640 [Photobacterium aphoticum]